MRKLIPVKKQCSCGVWHLFIPADAKFQDDPDGVGISGWFWNCACKSTLFMPLSKLKAAS